MKSVANLAALLCLVMLFAGCSHDAAPTATRAKPAKNSQARSGPATERKTADAVVDSLGRQIDVGARPRRIVSLSPAVTELLFAIGAGDRVAGVTSYCDYPQEAQGLEKVGGFSPESLSIEKIISLRPDSVLSAGKIHQAVISQLERLGIPVTALEPESFPDLYRAIETLGRLTGNEPQAAELSRSIERRVAKVENTARKIPAHRRRTVLYQVWREPLLAAGPTSLIGRLIESSGANNLLSDASTPYPEISLEVAIARNPQVILIPSRHAAEMSPEQFANDPAWRRVQAIRDGKVKAVDGDRAARFGPRIVDALEEIAAAVYPEYYGEGTSEKTATVDAGGPRQPAGGTTR